MRTTLITQLMGPLERLVLQCLWDQGPLTNDELHAAVSKTRPVAPCTVSTVAARLARRGFLIRDVPLGRRQPATYIPRFTRADLLVYLVEKACREFGATDAERARAIALLQEHHE
jgi:predicted transcriptional regulator